jgi:hypothetical protein
VVRGTPFTVHLITGRPCGGRGFRPGATADQSAVTYAPLFFVEDGAVCPLTGAPTGIAPLVLAMDTTDVFAGLSADYPRSYEMRGVASVLDGSIGVAASEPVRTFGEIDVRITPFPPGVLPPIRNAAGVVSARPDNASACSLVVPYGTRDPDAAMALADSPDTVSFWVAFVRGYITPVPACGASRTFHLVSRN